MQSSFPPFSSSDVIKKNVVESGGGVGLRTLETIVSRVLNDFLYFTVDFIKLRRRCSTRGDGLLAEPQNGILLSPSRDFFSSTVRCARISFVMAKPTIR